MRYASQSGNWSDPNTWGGSVPTSEDVELNGYTVTVDGDIYLNGYTIYNQNGGYLYVPDYGIYTIYASLQGYNQGTILSLSYYQNVTVTGAINGYYSVVASVSNGASLTAQGSIYTNSGSSYGCAVEVQSGGILIAYSAYNYSDYGCAVRLYDGGTATLDYAYNYASNYGSAIRVEGGTLTINYDGSNQASWGTCVDLTMSGSGSAGITINGSISNGTTYGSCLNFSGGGSSVSVALTSSITNSGDYAKAVYASGSGTRVTSTGSIQNNGQYSYGAYAEYGATITSQGTLSNYGYSGTAGTATGGMGTGSGGVLEVSGSVQDYGTSGFGLYINNNGIGIVHPYTSFSGTQVNYGCIVTLPDAGLPSNFQQYGLWLHVGWPNGWPDTPGTHWMLPRPSDVRTGTMYLNDLLNGVLTLPSATDVRYGTYFDNWSQMGVLTLPAPANVRAGIAYDNGTKVGTLLDLLRLPRSRT